MEPEQHGPAGRETAAAGKWGWGAFFSPPKITCTGSESAFLAPSSSSRAGGAGGVVLGSLRCDGTGGSQPCITVSPSFPGGCGWVVGRDGAFLALGMAHPCHPGDSWSLWFGFLGGGPQTAPTLVWAPQPGSDTVPLARPHGSLAASRGCSPRRR